MQIGKYNWYLREIKNLYLYDFGIFIEMSPDEEQKAQLEANIQMALAQKDISLEDAIDIREIRNLKLANQLLKVKRKQKQEQMQQMKLRSNRCKLKLTSSHSRWRHRLRCKSTDGDQAKMQATTSRSGYAIEKIKNEAAIKAQLMDESSHIICSLKDVEQSQIGREEP